MRNLIFNCPKNVHKHTQLFSNTAKLSHCAKSTNKKYELKASHVYNLEPLSE